MNFSRSIEASEKANASVRAAYEDVFGNQSVLMNL